MAKKNRIPSTEAQMENLKTLNNRLLKVAADGRKKNEKLRSELASLAADHEILDVTEREVFRLVLSEATARTTEMTGKMLKKAELAATELHEAERRLLAMAREKDEVKSFLERTAKERDLSRSDLDEKRKEVEELKTFIPSLEQVRKEKQVADAKCGKLEEELQSAMHEKDFLERILEDNKQLVEKLVREMVLMKIEEGVDFDVLKTENEENCSKISALEEERRSLKEVRGELENELCGMKVSVKKLEEEKVEAWEDHKRNMTELGRLEKEKLELQKKFDLKEEETALQMNELKRNMTKMAAEKDFVDQASAKYEIQISNLQAEISKLQSARKSLEDAHSTCSEKLAVIEDSRAAMQRKMNQAVAQEMLLQKKLNHLTTENVDTKKRINSLIFEKASLEKQLEISNQGLQDIEKKLKISEDASSQVCSLLKKMTAEVMDAERTQANYNSRERGLEIENYEEIKLFVDNLDAIKLAMKDKDARIKDLNQGLELLQVSVTCGKSKWGIWKWLFPATTTIFAAVSLAYAARAR
ncbi:putative leucine-rich repeat-containing protein DDB_G0290503 [Phalaenopsis equestris]|uniref:putative leucine-rich repeat-containing protein DDB_G0290503 n=1 Tax=Phalaenopsis equestris TaxID=78828 RepID=UPI0009E46F1E|nr:putative leucine-rich repeat-containing protein DDB_G0290503 [Phalaenopsis equestris]